MNNEEKKIQIELENQMKNLAAIQSQKKLQEKNVPQIQVPTMISLNNVPFTGLNIPILEKDLLSRLRFYSQILSDVEIRITKTFSGNIKLSEIFMELHDQILKNRFKIIKGSKPK